MGRLQKLSKSCCSCWAPAGNVEHAGSTAFSLLQRQDPAQQLPPCTWLHPSIPPNSSTLAASARWIQRCSFRFSPVSFSTLIFNSVSTDRCRQMWAHPARTPRQADLCQPLSRSHRAILAWLRAQANMPAEKAWAEEACVCLHRAWQACPGKLRTSYLSWITDNFFLNRDTGMEAKGSDRFRKGHVIFL